MKLFVGLVVLFSATAHAAPQQMVRFWRGYAQNRADLEGLRQSLNNGFIKETVMVGAGRGLLAYMPVMFDRRNDPVIPDEVALVIYENKEKYDGIRATPRGKRYGEAHFSEGMFTRKTPEGLECRSQEAIPYNGLELTTLTTPSAFVMQSQGHNWQSGITLFRIMKQWSSVTLPMANAELKAISNAQGAGVIKSGVILIDGAYIMEYIQVAGPTELTRALTVLAQSSQRWTVLYPTMLRPVQPTRPSLHFREGLNLFFDPNTPLTVDME